MKKIKNFIIILIIIVVSILIIQKKEEKLIEKEMSSFLHVYIKNDKKVIFRGVSHLAEKQFYNKVFNETIFYKEKGYMFFYEKMKKTKNINNKTIIENFNKKINNYKINMYAKNYKELYKQSIFEEIYRYKYNIFKYNSVSADLTEDEFAKKLIEYDYKNKDYEFLYNNILIKERNKVIIEKIKKTNNNIYIMYGLSHLEDLEIRLKKIGYKKINKKNKIKIMEYYTYE